MQKRLSTLLICSLVSVAAVSADKDLTVTVANHTGMDKTNEPIVLKVNKYGMEVTSALVTLDGKEIPCQLDDMDRDGVSDELCFLTDITKKNMQTFKVTLSDTGKPRVYSPKTYAELMVLNRKVKIKNKQDLYLSEMTVEKGVNPYQQMNHHGVAFENELLCMRVYFDHRQTVDLYGKISKRLELKDTQFYPDAEQKANGYGDDVLWVGTSYGLGALRGWNGTKQTMLNDVDRRSQRVIASGPLRTIVEIEDRGWTQDGGNETVDMTTRYILYAGHRDCDVNVWFRKPTYSLYSTGLVNVKGSDEYSNKNGIRGCWGTDWPVALKDTANHKRETVGLGIYIPKQYIVSEEKADADEYTFVIKPQGTSLNYKITYCSANENFGYHSKKEWFQYLKEWEEQLSKPLVVTVSE